MWWIETIKILLGIGIAVGVIIWWIKNSNVFIKPDEMGILVIFGAPKRVCKSGWVFDLRLPLPGCFVKKFPKKRFNLDFPAIGVTSKEGYYPEKGRKKKWYSAITFRVHVTVYLRFPRETEKIDTEPALFEIYRSAVPTEEKTLRDWIKEAVVSSARLAFGKITWREATIEISKVIKDVETILKSVDGALIKAGFTSDCISLVIPEIDLPAELEEAQTNVEQQKLQAEAAPFEAKQIAIETARTAVITMLSEQIGTKEETLQKELKENPQEFIQKYRELIEKNYDLVYRRMGIEGAAYLDIRVPGGSTIEGLIALLSGRLPMGRKIKHKERTERIKKPPKRKFRLTDEERDEIYDDLQKTAEEMFEEEKEQEK